jgi:hypothetical protein
MSPMRSLQNASRLGLDPSLSRRQMAEQARSVWTFLVSSTAVFMVALDNLVVSTALPVIRVDLGASIEELEWTVNAYTLSFAMFLLTGAGLGDRFGRKRFFVPPPSLPRAGPSSPRARYRDSAAPW